MLDSSVIHHYTLHYNYHSGFFIIMSPAEGLHFSALVEVQVSLIWRVASIRRPGRLGTYFKQPGIEPTVQGDYVLTSCNFGCNYRTAANFREVQNFAFFEGGQKTRKLKLE